MPTRNINNDLKVNANLYLNMDTNSLSGDSNGAVVLAGYDSLTLKTQSSPRVTINSSGNVGIGTNSPSEKLEVIGNGKLSGTLTITNDMVISSSGNRSITWGTNDLSFISATTTGLRVGPAEVRVNTKFGLHNAGGLNNNTELLGMELEGSQSSHYSHAIFAVPQVNHIPTNLYIRGEDGAYGGGSTKGVSIYIHGGDNTTSTNQGDVILAHDGSSARGNVGIGTTSPSAKLDIDSVFTFNTSTDLLTITNNQNTGGINLSGGNSRIYFGGYRAIEGDQSGGTLYIGEGYGAISLMDDVAVSGGVTVSGALNINVGSSIHGTITSSSSSLTLNARNTGIMLFQSGGSEKMRIASSGNVGIGTTSPASKLHVAGTASIDTLEYNSIVSVFGQSRTKLNELSDVFYKADLRFTVTGGSPNFFNGNFDSSGNLPTNTTNVINVNVAGQQGVPSNGITYPQGAVYISFYYTNHAYTAISLRHKSNGVYYSSTGTDVSTNSGYKVIKFPISGNNYLTDIEISITTDANLVKVAGINYLADRWTTQLELPYVSKYLTSNTVFGEFGISGTSGSAGPHLKLEGTYTTWELENQYTGGATNDMFRIRNTALSSDALVINRGNNNVGIGTTNPSNKLTVEDTIGIKRSGVAAITTLQQTGSGLTLNAPSGYHPLIIKHNGTELVRFKNDGNVGIGTTSPSTELEVVGAKGADGIVTVGDTNAVAAGVGGEIDFEGVYTGSTRTVFGSIEAKKTNATAGHYGAGLALSTRVNGGGSLTERLTILEGGNVGIGTTSPTEKLHISSTTTATLAIQSGSNNAEGSKMRLTEGATYNGGFIHYDGSANALKLGVHAPFNSTLSDDTTAITIPRDTGNVGIGTTSPGYKLQIHNGNAAITGGSSSYLFLNTNTSYLYGDQNGVVILEGYDNVRFRTQGSERMRINSSGNITLGTASVAAANGAADDFHIKSTGDSGITISSGNSSTGTIFFGDVASSTIAGFRYNHNTGDMAISAEDNVTFACDNVGIGTTGPTSPLTIKSNSVSASDSALTIQGNSNTNAIVKIAEKSTDGARFHMYDGGVEKIAFYTDGTANHISAGNVGIGTTSPSAKLDVRYDSSKDGIFVKDEGGGAVMLFGADGSNNARARFYNGSHSQNIEINSNAGSPTYFNAGNVGIGTSSPNAKLELVGKQMITTGANASPQTEDYLYIGGDGLAGTDAAIYIGNRGNGSGYGWRMFYEGTGSGVNNKLKFKSENLGSPVDVITMLQDGKVGIGTTSPSSLLHLEAAASPALQIKDTTNNVTFKAYAQDSNSHLANTSNHDLFIDTNNTPRITVKADGKVGINTGGSSLFNAFTVNGNANIHGGDGSFLTFNNGDANITVHYDGSTGRDLSFKTWNSTQGNIERMRLDKDGNLGIGTADPNAKLEIHQAQVTTQFDRDCFLRLHPTATTNSGGFTNIMFGTSPVNNYGVAIGGLRAGTDGTPSFSIRMLNDSITGTEVLRISNDGKIQIGNNIPMWSGSYGGALFLKGNNANSDRYAQLTEVDSTGASTSTGLVVRAGNVGIGTTSPTQKLDIGAGHIRLDAGYSLQWDNSHERIEQSDGHLEFFVNNTESMTLDTNGLSLTTSLTVEGGILHLGKADTASAHINSKELMTFNIDTDNDDTNRYFAWYANGESGSGTELLRIEEGGNVGIGTTSPNEKLEVNGSVRVGNVKIQNANGGRIGLNRNTSTGAIYNNTFGAFQIQNNSTTGFEIQGYNTGGGLTGLISMKQSDGYVGIGIASPTTKFHIDDNATSGTGLLVTGGGVGNPLATFTRDVGGSGSVEISSRDSRPQIKLAASSNTFALGVNGSTFEIADNTALGTNPRLSINSSGNVGIGTTSPTEKLHVEGNLELTSSFQIGSNSGSYWQRIRTEDAVASTTNAFNFETRNGSGSFIKHVVIRNDGNVGVGNATPATKLAVEGTIAHKVYTVSTLPSASPAGQRAFVSDGYYTLQQSHGSGVYGGGSNFCPVYSDGSNWFNG